MSAFDKITRQVQKKPLTKKRILTPQLDSDVSQRSDAPNIFLQSSNQYITNITHNQIKPNLKKTGKNVSNRRTANMMDQKKIKTQEQQLTLDMKQGQSNKNQIQLVDDEQIPQGQQAQQNTQFSVLDSYKYYMGHLTNPINYPINKIIFIDNNNEDENIQNRKQIKIKRNTNQNFSLTNQYYLENKISLSWIFYFLHVITNIFLFHIQFYIYLAILILSFVVHKYVFWNNAQYTVEPVILLVVTILYFVSHLVLQFFMKKKRNTIKQNEDQFKVYFHDGVQAEWGMISSINMKAGYIYKIPPGSKFPTDTLLLHSNQALTLIEQNQIIGKMPQTISRNSLKQTVIKSQTIILPLSGNLEYIIKKAQVKNNWIQGRLILQQPIQIKHNVNPQNIVLKGSKNISNNQILCMALQVGVGSFNLKGVQYPYRYKNNEQIIESHPQILTIQKFSSYFIQISCIVYVVLSGIGILVGFLTMNMTNSHYYLGEQVKVAHLVFYHFTNFIIFIPIFLQLSVNAYLLIMGKLTESNISKRQFQFSQSQQQNSLSQTIGKINIKDYSILPYMNNEFTIFTGIQIFKQRKQFKLKKILVKQVKLQVDKINIDNEIFSQQHRHLIKYFMAVSLLTSTIQNNAQQNTNSFQNSIKKSSKQHFNLKIRQERQYICVQGPLQAVFTNGKLQVLNYFSVKSCNSYPFSINFFEIPNQTQKQLQSHQKRVLCIIRGDPQYILMKAYGKKVNLLNQADKFHQDEGLQVQFVGKFTISFVDAQILKEAYKSPKTSIDKFYSMLEQFMKKIQPMGIMGFQNQFNQQNMINMKINPFLNLSTIKRNIISNNNQQTFTSQKLPKIIIINPISQNYCKRPQFQSVNTINNILANPLLFNFSQQQIGQKILYDPVTPQQLIQKLNKQRVIIFNGWDRTNIQLMIKSLKQKGLLSIGLIQKNDQIYLTKLCDYSISRNSLAEDISKYTDIDIQQRAQTPKVMSFLSVMQLINHDSQLVYQGMYYIVLIHIIKFLAYLTIEAINIVFTLGNGLTVMRLPLYLITEIVVLFDILYHLNVADSTTFKIRNKKPDVLIESVKTIAICIISTFIIIYSSVSPSSQEGTPTNSIFCILHIHLFITHILIFSKLSWTSQINWFKTIIIIVQLIIYYIGMLIVSQTSLYQFNGVIRYMFNSKIYLVSVMAVWIFINFTFNKIVMNLSSDLGLNKKQNDHKYQQIKRVTKENNNLDILQF